MSEPTTPTSWGSQCFVHFKYADMGKWIDSTLRFATEEDAKQHAQKLLDRIIASHRAIYRVSDAGLHAQAFPSFDCINVREIPLSNGEIIACNQMN